MNEDMNIPETVRFLLQQQAQFYNDLQAMRAQFAADLQAMQVQMQAQQAQFQELTQTVNAIAAAHLRLTDAHRQLEDAHRRIAEAHAVLELRAAETEAKLNALIDIVSRQQTPPDGHAKNPPAPGVQ
jgi:peptidoglycan hydrolase CwlO-like protein